MGILKILTNKAPGQSYEFQQLQKWQEFGIFANFPIFTPNFRLL